MYERYGGRRPDVPGTSLTDGPKAGRDCSGTIIPSLGAIGTLQVSYANERSTPAPDTTPAVDAAADRLPDIAGYEIEDVIGRGGMGIVYKARDVHLGRDVAIKMVVGGSIAGESMRHRFDCEARAVAQLQHTHIAQLYTTATLENCPYFVMEFVSGGTLAHRIQGNPFSPHDAAVLLIKLADAMEFSHQQGIIHRDLKPANVLLTGAGEPKIADFGLAKWMDQDSGSTKTGDIIGTPSYMAPEQAGGVVKSVGLSCDVYALGAILYELLTGRPPFRTPEPLQTVMLVLSEDPVSPRKLQPTVPHDLETICLKCLEKNPAKRYDTAGELAADIRRFLAHEPIVARPVGRIERAWKWVERFPALATMISLLFLGVASGFAGALYHSREMSAVLLETETERDNVRTERDKARQERDRSRQLFEAGRGLAKSLYEEHLDALEGLPGGLKVRERLASRLATYLDDLSKNSEDDIDLLADLADWYQRVANVQGNPYGPNRGATEDALRSYRKALALREKVLTERPDSIVSKLQHAVCRKQIADVLFRRGSISEAREEYERILQFLKTARCDFPKDNRILAVMIEVIASLADVDTWEARLQPALQHCRHSLALCDEFIPLTEQKQAIHREIRTLQQIRIGELLEKMLRFDEAEPYYRKVYLHRKMLLDGNPKDARRQAQYAAALVKLADMEARRRRFQSSRTLYARALPIYRSLAKQDRENDSIQGLLAQVCGRIGTSYLLDPSQHTKQMARRGIPYFEKSLAIRQRLADKSPIDIERQQNLGTVQRQLAVAYAQAESYDHADRCNRNALATARRQEKLQPGSPAAMELRACCFSDLAVLASQRAKRSVVEGRHNDAQRHFSQCIQYFTQSHATWREYGIRHEFDARTRKLRDSVDKMRKFIEQEMKRLLSSPDAKASTSNMIR